MGVGGQNGEHGDSMHLLATMIVFEFPPRLSFRSQVNTESR